MAASKKGFVASDSIWFPSWAAAAASATGRGSHLTQHSRKSAYWSAAPATKAEK